MTKRSILSLAMMGLLCCLIIGCTPKSPTPSDSTAEGETHDPAITSPYIGEDTEGREDPSDTVETGGEDTLEETSTEESSQNTEDNSEEGTTAPAGPDADIRIQVVTPEVTVEDQALESLDIPALFHITMDGMDIPVERSYVDSSKVSTKPGRYPVFCSFGGVRATAYVTVFHSTYSLVLETPMLTISIADVKDFDGLAYFKGSVNGEARTLTSDMVTTDLQEKPGNYTYTVSFGTEVKTLLVTVTQKHVIEILPAYSTLVVTAEELAALEPVKLFALFVDGLPVPVTPDMITSTQQGEAAPGQAFRITLTYSLEDSTASYAIPVELVSDQAVTIKALEHITYPNSTPVDLTSLFLVTKGDVVLPVTMDMIEGEVDLSREGENPIILRYPGCAPVTAVVTVKRGVVIIAPEVIEIRKGTDMSTYSFVGDYRVVVNGLLFRHLHPSMLDTSLVDFSTEGDYPVTLTLRYNEAPLSGLAQNAKYTTHEKTIIYRVTAHTYTAEVKKEELLLVPGQGEFDPFANLRITVDGRNQSLTTVEAYADSITCYVRLLSDPIDMSKAAPQEVSVAAYVRGVHAEPVVLTYTVTVDSGIVLEGKNAVVFTGENLSVSSLFSITRQGQPVPVEYTMLSGRVDLFTPGVYTVTLTYMGLTCDVRITVLDGHMVGTYHSGQSTVPVSGEEDEEGYESSVTEQTPLPALAIRQDGSIRLGQETLVILDAIDPTTILVKRGSYMHTLYYLDGILILDPDNSIKLGFFDGKRPLIYFQDQRYDTLTHLVVNSTSKHVLETTSVCYSIDTFRLRDKKTGEEFWYGLKVHLISKTSADTVYKVTWGRVEYSRDFMPVPEAKGVLRMADEVHPFTMVSDTVGKTDTATSITKEWANMTFTGSIDGVSALLTTNQFEHYSLTVGGKRLFSLTEADISVMKNGGVDYATKTLFFYDPLYKSGEPFCYKLTVDLEAMTFTQLPRDPYYGLYVQGDKTLFLDGYGTGFVILTKSLYERTSLCYTVKGQQLDIRYLNTQPGFAYGSGASFFLSPLLNRLTVKEDTPLGGAGTEFINGLITEGALVEVGLAQVGAGVQARDELLNNIRIYTAQGELTGREKANCIDLKAVKFTAEGFYQFTITIPVRGENVTSYYALQVLPLRYEGSPLVYAYGQGTLVPANSFRLDAYGRATLTIGDRSYTGLADISEEGSSFVAHARAGDGTTLTIKGRLVEDGLLRVETSGTSHILEIFTTGRARVIGCSGHVLRVYTIGDKIYYRLSTSATGEGTPARVEVLSGDLFSVGAVLQITTEKTTVIARVQGWDNPVGGLLLSDALRGTYTAEGLPDLVVSGFGTAVCDGQSSTYELSGGLLILRGATLRAYRLNTETMTYTEQQFQLRPESLVGSTFRASYNFLCGSYAYIADTAFSFEEGGYVTVVSTSTDHDDYEVGCEEDIYEPPFASAKGVRGSYTLQQDLVTVVVNGYTFVFRITDLTGLSRITHMSSTLSSDDHGYIKPDTLFAR